MSGYCGRCGEPCEPVIYSDGIVSNCCEDVVYLDATLAQGYGIEDYERDLADEADDFRAKEIKEEGLWRELED